MNGTEVLLLVNTGTELAPVYTVVGSQRGLSVDETSETIDVSSKNTGRPTLVEPGRYASTMSLDALYVPNNAAYLALKNANRDGTHILVRKSEEGVEVEEADAVVTGISGDFPDQDAAVISVDLTINGEWYEVEVS